MKVVIGLYTAMIFIVWIYLGFWGDMAHKGLMFNLGRALVWPAVMFPIIKEALTLLVVLAFVGFITFGMRR